MCWIYRQTDRYILFLSLSLALFRFRQSKKKKQVFNAPNFMFDEEIAGANEMEMKKAMDFVFFGMCLCN